MTWIVIIVMVLVAFMFTTALAQTSHQFDKDTYVQITKKNIGRILTGKVSPDLMIADMEKLIELGLGDVADDLLMLDKLPRKQSK